MEKNNTYHIFISYRRKCSDKTARILQLALEKAGYDVFLDYDALNNNSTFTERIRKAIENSPIFILLLVYEPYTSIVPIPSDNEKNACPMAATTPEKPSFEKSGFK